MENEVEIDVESEATLAPPKVGGGLVFCGHALRLASDDFVLPATLAGLARILFLVATISITSYAGYGLEENTCLNKHRLDIYLPLAIGVIGLHVVTCGLLAWNSSKGVIWDSNVNSRRWVAPLLYTSVFLALVEVAVLTVGTVWICQALLDDCQETSAETTVLYIILTLVVFKWLGIIISLSMMLLSFKALLSLCCKKRSNKLSVQGESRGMCFNIFRFFCLCGNNQIGYFNDVADLLDDIFVDQAFVPTDVAAALILLFAQAHLVPWGDRVQPLEPETETSSSANLLDPDVILPAFEDNVETDQNTGGKEDLAAYIPYAVAAYGWAIYLFDTDQRCSRGKSLCGQIKCCSSCCCCFPWSTWSKQDYVQEDNCCGCNMATIQLQLNHVAPEDFVHVSFRNQFLETPFLVVADPKVKKIVIAIRGTLTLSDLLTDMVAKPQDLRQLLQELDLSDLEKQMLDTFPAHMKVHGGMAKAALYVFQELKKNFLIEKAHTRYPDYQDIVVTGHSLGAGTAVILAFLMRLKYGNHVKCYAYAPPGGLLSPEAAAFSRDFVTAVVIGDDIVPRLSMKSYVQLREEMKRVLVSCQLPKYKIITTGVFGFMRPNAEKWKQRLKKQNFVVNQVEVARNYGAVEGGAERSTIYDSATDWPTLVPPENIVHLVSVDKDQHKVLNRHHRDFSDILVSPGMIADHAPSTFMKVLCGQAEQHVVVEDVVEAQIHPVI